MAKVKFRYNMEGLCDEHTRISYDSIYTSMARGDLPGKCSVSFDIRRHTFDDFESPRVFCLQVIQRGYVLGASDPSINESVIVFFQDVRDES